VPSGILLLDKPLGLSSNAALQRVRRALGAHKAGHVGTLDPLASGMLPVCLDEATKVVADIESGRKAYEFSVAFGSRTSTGDAEGAEIERASVPELSREAIERVLAALRGAQRQTPPMYSAIKRSGRPLYELARAGIEVERAARPVVIHELRLIECGPTLARCACECSKGTYIRALAEDIARALGTVGHVVALRRAWVEPFEGLGMVELEQVLDDPVAARHALLAPDRALGFLAAVTLQGADIERCRHGQRVAATVIAPSPEGGMASGTRVRLYAASGGFLGLGEWLGDGSVQPKRLLAPEPRA
jgi:tRNA pseudouridine55 synthase